jgi:hypothetical protein
MESVQGQVLPGTDSRLVLRSRLGAITLVLLCAVQFLDIADSAIVNVAVEGVPKVAPPVRFESVSVSVSTPST